MNAALAIDFVPRIVWTPPSCASAVSAKCSAV